MSPLVLIPACALLVAAYHAAVWRGRYLERDFHLNTDDAPLSNLLFAVCAAGVALVLVWRAPL
jgi:hypothetical protein